MEERYATMVNELSQFNTTVEISSESISQKLRLLEKNFLKAQFNKTNQISCDIQFYLIHTKTMLDFARQNITKGFLNLADSSLLLAKDYLDRCELAAE